jgi:hypothetical protein
MTQFVKTKTSFENSKVGAQKYVCLEMLIQQDRIIFTANQLNHTTQNSYEAA